MSHLEREYPRFVSDVSRGYLAVGITGALAFAIPFALVALGVDRYQVLLTGSLFIMWIVAATLLAVLPFLVMGHASGAELARWLSATTPPPGKRIWWSINGGGAVSWAVTGAGVAVGSVVGVSRDPDLRGEPFIIVLCILVVLCSLFVIITAYAVRYARENSVSPGLEFPSTPEPRLIDYLYLAIQVGTTFGGSDVEVTTSSMRRIVSVNSLISFAYNTVVIALLVSVLMYTVT
jgi:hypothetical protein